MREKERSSTNERAKQLLQSHQHKHTEQAGGSLGQLNRLGLADCDFGTDVAKWTINFEGIPSLYRATKS